MRRDVTPASEVDVSFTLNLALRIRGVVVSFNTFSNGAIATDGVFIPHVLGPRGSGFLVVVAAIWGAAIWICEKY